jgi:hypothetical protein
MGADRKGSQAFILPPGFKKSKLKKERTISNINMRN